MKIGVITLHRVTNFGSLLQTYATQTVLEKLGHQAEIIDFVPEGLSFFRSVWPKGSSVGKKLLKLIPLAICNFVQFSMTDSFLRKYIHLSARRFKCYEELEKACPTADVYLSGSDQVWNTQNNNPENDLGAYYLAFAGDYKRVAYAGSFGKDTFTQDEKQRIAAWLAQYDALSVREDTAVDILKDLGLKGVHVVDPTLLLTPDEWKQLCSGTRPEPGYVFVYNLNRNKVLEKAAQAIAEKKNLRIVNFADTFEFIKGAENRYGNDPIDFLDYLSNADYVVTDSFHGTAFSLNFSRQFLSIPAPKYNCRLESILRICGCNDRMFNTVEEALKLADQCVDYASVSGRLREARAHSQEFLKHALEERS